MDHVEVVLLGDPDQALDAQVRPDRLAAVGRADEKGFIGFEAVQGKRCMFARTTPSSQRLYCSW